MKIEKHGTGIERTARVMWPVPETDEPDIEQVYQETEDSYGSTSCAEYCEVEPDGICPHGHPSWLLRWGMI